jgi:hypothetical protein
MAHPPIQTPFSLDDGTMTPSWQLYFTQELPKALKSNPGDYAFTAAAANINAKGTLRINATEIGFNTTPIPIPTVTDLNTAILALAALGLVKDGRP